VAEVETREMFRERITQILSRGSVNVGTLTRQLRREGYAVDSIPRALQGVGVTVDHEGKATIEPGPRQSRLR